MTIEKRLKVLVAVCALGTSPVMASGDIAAGKEKATSTGCVNCHGADGNSVVPNFPKLAGQGEAYLVKQLQDFASGARQDPVMAPFVASLTEQDMADLSAFYAAQTTSVETAPELSFQAGEKFYLGGNKETGVPACSACHGPNGAGMPAAKWPALAGQHSMYTEGQLNAFANGQRTNDPNEMMRDIAARMSEDEKKAVSAYISGLH